MPEDVVAAAFDASAGLLRLSCSIREDLAMSSAPVAAEVLQGLGFPVRLVVEDEVDLSPDRLLFVSGATRSYKRTLERVAAIPPAHGPSSSSGTPSLFPCRGRPGCVVSR